MFIHHEATPGGAFFISQACHAMMAWVLAEHWGNRNYSRPAPRAEFLAAVFLHDAGWFDFDRNPDIDDEGRPLTFDRMPVECHLEIWRDGILRAAAHSRYAGLLVAAHFGRLVEHKLRDQRALNTDEGVGLVESYEREMAELQNAWTSSLASDPRYEPFLYGPARDANADILAACDRISVFLCADLGSPFEVEAPKRGGGVEKITFTEISERCWRVRPWPFTGDVVRLNADALPLPKLCFADELELHDVMAQAPSERLRFEILRSSRQQS